MILIFLFRTFYDGCHYYEWAKKKAIDDENNTPSVNQIQSDYLGKEAKSRFPDVPEKEMNIVKEKNDSCSKYELYRCKRRTILLVAPEKIPPCSY